MANIARNMGLGVVLTMQNRLSGPAVAASSSMAMLTAQTEKARIAQVRFEAAMGAGKMALIGAGGASLALGLVANEAAKFEEGMARVGAVLDPTTAQFKNLTAAAVEAGIKTRWSPRQATEGLKELATAGFDATESQKALLPVLDLATGSLGQLGVAQSATAATAAIRGFGLEAKDTGRVVDTLLRSTQLTNLQARDFEVSLGLVSGQAKAAGQEFEHTVAILGALRNTGMSASVSATSLQNALRGIVQPKAQRALADLGVSVKDQDGNFRSLADIIFDVQKATKGMAGVQKFMTLQTIFGVRGLRAYNAIATMGQKKFKGLENSLKNAAGTAETFRKKILSSLIGRIALMIGSIFTLANQLGKPLLAPIKLLVTGFTKFLNILIKLTQWFPITTGIIMKVVGLTTVITGMIGVMLVLGAVLLKLNSTYKLLEKAKLAYFFVSTLVFGMEGMTRKQVLLSLVADKLKLTHTDLMNAKTKVRILLEKILGIGISRNTSITYASVAAAWAQRVSTIGNNVALGINNALRWINNKLTWGGIKAMFFNAKAAVMNSTAMTGASAATGMFSGALQGLKAAIVSNPILLLIAVVVLAAVAFVKLAKAFWEAEGAMKAVFGLLLFALFPAIAPLIFFAKILHSAWTNNIAGIRSAFMQLKEAVMSIFAPIGKLFSSLEGVGKLGGLFSSVIGLFLKPIVWMIQRISIAATVLGAIIEIVVNEVSAILAPLQPAIDDLSAAFDELSTSVFGSGGANLGFWKKFGKVVRQVIKFTLIPLAKVVGWIVKVITFLTRAVKAIIGPIKQFASAIAGIIEKGVGFVSNVISGAASIVGFQHGGIVPKGKAVNAQFEGKSTEVVMPLPSGMRPADLQRIFKEVTERKPEAIATAPGKVVIENVIMLDGFEIARYQSEQDMINTIRDFGEG